MLRLQRRQRGERPDCESGKWSNRHQRNDALIDIAMIFLPLQPDPLINSRGFALLSSEARRQIVIRKVCVERLPRGWQGVDSKIGNHKRGNYPFTDRSPPCYHNRRSSALLCSVSLESTYTGRPEPMQREHHLDGTHAPDNSRYGSKDNRAVQEEILIPNIVQVILQIFVNGKCPCWTDLPQTRYPWSCRKPLALCRMIACHNEWHLRPWTHQAHLTLKNIDQLRYLI